MPSNRRDFTPTAKYTAKSIEQTKTANAAGVCDGVHRATPTPMSASNLDSLNDTVSLGWPAEMRPTFVLAGAKTTAGLSPVTKVAPWNFIESSQTSAGVTREKREVCTSKTPTPSAWSGAKYTLEPNTELPENKLSPETCPEISTVENSIDGKSKMPTTLESYGAKMMVLPTEAAPANASPFEIILRLMSTVEKPAFGSKMPTHWAPNGAKMTFPPLSAAPLNFMPPANFEEISTI
mmetsp:Transcript_73474/g.206312  ORF Transcript_73474/g.206312 Transcript_73474/m.206312 type:complete len:236 (+) Transcript_73474:278-985(+)